MKKRPDLTEATRQRFVNSFCEIYKNKPVAKITVREIAERAGHNRVTFYQYFRDAYDILESMENEMFEYIKEVITENIGRENMFDDFAAVFDRILTGRPDLAQILLTGANCGNTLERCKNAMLPVLLKAFSIQEDDYKSCAIFEFYLSGVVSLLKYKVERGGNVTTQELGNIVQAILRNGIIPQLRAEGENAIEHNGESERGNEYHG